jgi:hypothetical protein
MAWLAPGVLVEAAFLAQLPSAHCSLAGSRPELAFKTEVYPLFSLPSSEGCRTSEFEADLL